LGIITTGIYWEKIYSKRLFIAIFILWSFFFSCKAQTSLQLVFEQAQGSPIVMTCGPGNIVAGDVNNDGKPDFVVACRQKRSLTIFIGRGDGLFDATTSSPVLLPYPPTEIVIGDMNGDGHADLIIGSHDSYGIMILPGDGKGNFTVSPNSSVTMKEGNHPHTHGLGIGDLNGDGHPDIVTANNSDNDIAVVLSNGRGGFIPASGSPFTVSPSPYPLTIGDVNSDGHLDIVSTSTNPSSQVLTLLLGDGRGDFPRSDISLRTASPWFVANGDINKDHIPDLVITHAERSELTVVIGSGSGHFTEVIGSPFNLGSSAWHVAIVDLNRDGNPDVIAAANNGVRVMFGDGKGQFVSAPGSPFPTGKGTWQLAVSDVNGDGRPDVVTCNLESNNVSVLLGR
jgi:hypothetical protein